MKKILLLFAVILLFGAEALAQQAPAIGIRLGVETTGRVFGATIQQPIGDHSVLEGILTAGKKDMRLTALYEYHQELPLRIKGVNWYIGGGFHVARLHSSTLEGILNDIMNGNIDINGEPDKNFYGLDAIAGLQWNIPKMPVNVSLDLKPALNLNTNSVDRFEFGGALSVRWTFGGGGGGSGKGKGSGTGTGSGSGTGSGTGKAGGVKGGNSGSSGSGTSTSGGGKTRTYTPPSKPGSTGTAGSGTTTKPSKTKTYTPPGSPTPQPTPPVPEPTPPPNPNPNDNDTGNGDDSGNNNGESWGDDDGGGL